MSFTTYKQLIYILIISLFPIFSQASNIECDKLDFKGGVFAYFDMQDDNVQEVERSHIFQALTDGLVFHSTEKLAQAHYLEDVDYKMSDIKYEISHHPESNRCQITFEYEVTKQGESYPQKRKESFELIALSFSGIYWFGQRDTAYSEAYFYLEKVD